MGTIGSRTARMGATGGVLICCLFTLHLFGVEKSAPELQTTRHWKNSQPLSLQELRGKHVLLDFWGYWCVPCVRHMPNLMALHDAFSDRGLTVIGVHDASVQSVAELNERLARTRTNRRPPSSSPCRPSRASPDFREPAEASQLYVDFTARASLPAPGGASFE